MYACSPAPSLPSCRVRTERRDDHREGEGLQRRRAPPGATVTAVNVVQAATYTAQTTPQGAFVLAQVPPGTNVVSVELQGFKKVEKRDVVLGTATTVNAGEFVLDIGNVTETVTVQADAARLF